MKRENLFDSFSIYKFHERIIEKEASKADERQHISFLSSLVLSKARDEDGATMCCHDAKERERLSNI